MTWWRLPESNWGHVDFQSTALPTELKRQRAQGSIICLNCMSRAGPTFILKDSLGALSYLSFESWPCLEAPRL